MANYFLTLGICVAAIPDYSFGQELPSIQLDRPDQTECPFITPTRYIQIENGFTFETFDKNQRSFNYPSTLWKYGVNSNFELRLITELISETKNDIVSSGIIPVTIGFKTALIEEKGLLPKTSFIGHLTTAAAGSAEFRTDYMAPAFRFTMQHTLTSDISLAYNFGMEWDGENAAPTYVYTLTSGISLTDAIGGYIELYGYLASEKSADHRFDSGITYLINDNIMADISGGFGLTEPAPDYYISFGFSFRFKTTKK